MRKLTIIMAMVLVLAFGLALQAAAFTVGNLSQPQDNQTNYVITSVVPGAPTVVNETYNGNLLESDAVFGATSIRFPGITTHDGGLLTRPTSIPGVQNHSVFDKELVFTAGEIAAGRFPVEFKITNTGTIPWSDYEFFFHKEGQTYNSVTVAGTFDTFTQSLFGGTDRFEFFSTTGGTIAPGGFLDVTFDLNITGLGTVFPQFEVNQMASAVPVPPAVWLFGSGLLGLVGLRRKLKA